jgi:hypothetical protein
MILPSRPFAIWGLDILGPFPRANKGYWYLYVSIDKFTKWLEATPVVKINKQFAVNFIKSIIYRVGVPNRIITHNGSQFTNDAFQGYCEDLKTRTHNGLKKFGKKWIDELPCTYGVTKHHLVGPLGRRLLAFLRHGIIWKRTDDNCSLHPRVFQGIESTGKQ